MNYLAVENLTRHYGDILLFDNISFAINKDDKMALIARNGAGKSTLMNLITGRDQTVNGSISFSKHIRWGYLEQDPVLDGSKTIFDEIYAADNPLIKAVRAYEAALHTSNNAQLQTAMEQMDYYNAWDFESRVKQILGQFKIFDLEQQIGNLSGGQKKRVAFAKVLIDEPDFLILDEPTNHLDVEMIEWLEEYLRRTQMTLFLVTHDRYFLDRICTSILELDNASLWPYTGNYSVYVEKRRERYEAMQAEVDRAKNLMRKEQEWMRRQPKARTTKSKSRINSFYKLQEVAGRNFDQQQVTIETGTQRLGKKVLEFKALYKSFGDKKILDDFTYTFNTGERLGIIGANGAGKSTFLNIITETIKPDSGDVIHGETLSVGYYRQDGMQLKEDKKVIDIITDIAEHLEVGGRRISASQFLEQFLFTPKMQQLYVSRLSGGERKRLYLMTILMKQPNFLILDEPTNDLDIMTLNVLEEYLFNFKGCVVIVSHDRFFMDKLVDHLFVFEGDGIVSDFVGTYSEYRDFLKEEEVAQRELSEQKQKTETPKVAAQVPQSKLSFKEKKELEQLDKEIADLNSEKLRIENELSSGNVAHNELISKTNRVGEIIASLDEKEMRWLELSEK